MAASVASGRGTPTRRACAATCSSVAAACCTLRALRSTGSTVKVIAFSGYDDPETIAHARAAGADDFLSKTNDPSPIADAVERVHSRAATP